MIDFVKKRRRQGEVKKAKKEIAQELRIIRTVEPETVNSVTTKNKREVIDLAVDSGASETVISEDMLPSIPIKQGNASWRGVQYEVANGVRIPNLGEKKFQGFSEERTVQEHHHSGLRGEQVPAECEEDRGGRGIVSFSTARGRTLRTRKRTSACT